MKYLMTVFTALVLFLGGAGILSAQNEDSMEGDLQALMELFESTNGQDWKNSAGWSSTSMDLSNDIWGVGVETINGELRVVHIDLQRGTKSPPTPSADPKDILPGNNVSGELPNSIGNLTELRYFNIKQNFFTGTLPESMKNWTKVKRVLIGGHTREPKVGYYNHPTAGGVSGQGKTMYTTNRFSGILPDIFGSMISLEVFESQGHAATGRTSTDPDLGWQGAIPPNWPSSLKMLFLGWNNFEGSMPVGLTSTDLRTLHLHFNKLSGGLLPELGNLKNMTHLRLGNNNFSGSIPSGWEGFQSLQLLVLIFNDLNGTLPSFLFDGRNNWIEGFRVEFNNFEGEIPADVNPSDYPHWNVFSLSYNNFSGPIPDWIPNLRWIQLNMESNAFSGDLPSGFHNSESNIWKRLRNLKLQNNNLTGPLPKANPGPAIWSYYLENNNFTGTFSDEFAATTTNRALRVRVQNNNLSGSVPVSIANITNLSELYLNGNKFTQADLSGIKSAIAGSVDYRDENQNPDTGSDAPNDGDHEPGIPKAPGLELPLNNTDDVPLEGSVSWENTEADSYSVEVINEVTGDVVLVAETEVNSYAFTGWPEYSKSYKWRVKAMVGGEESEWSETWRFTTEDAPNTFPSAPLQFGPSHEAENVSLRPEFTWSDIGADYYIFHMSRANPTGMYIDVIVQDTTFTPEEILGDDATHDWRVRGVKDGEVGEWSEIRRFTTRDEGLPPVAGLISPGQFAQEVNPQTEFVWDEVNADSYEIRLINKRNSEILFTDVSASSVYKSDEVLPDTTEFVWQVKSIAGGVHGAWGPRWEFSTGIYQYSTEAPTLISPRQGDEHDDLTPVFEWSSVEADHYVIYVSREEPTAAKGLPGLQNESVVIFEETTETEYIPQNNLEPDTQYYWRVQAVKDGEGGEWSELWEFTTLKDQLPVGVDQEETPLTTSLDQNYPNPFNPSTQIKFTLTNIQEVSLKVYDMAGRQVATLVDGVRQAGQHSVTFNADHLSSGIYIYRFTSGTKQFTKKMTLVK